MEDLLTILNTIDVLDRGEDEIYVGEDLVECPVWYFRGLGRYSSPLYFLIMRGNRARIMREDGGEDSLISLGEIWDILPEETRIGLIFHLDLFR